MTALEALIQYFDKNVQNCKIILWLNYTQFDMQCVNYG